MAEHTPSAGPVTSPVFFFVTTGFVLCPVRVRALALSLCGGRATSARSFAGTTALAAARGVQRSSSVRTLCQPALRRLAHLARVARSWPASFGARAPLRGGGPRGVCASLRGGFWRARPRSVRATVAAHRISGQLTASVTSRIAASASSGLASGVGAQAAPCWRLCRGSVALMLTLLRSHPPTFSVPSSWSSCAERCP